MEAGKKASHRYYSVRNVLLSLLKRSIQAPIGLCCFLKLMWRKENTHYLIAPPHLGDTLRVFSYLDDYKIKGAYPHCTVVSVPSSQMQQIIGFYQDSIDAVCYIGSHPQYYLEIFGQTWLGQILSAYIFRDKITFLSWTCMLSWRGARGNRQFNLGEFVRKMLLQLPPEVRGKKPKIPDVDIEPYVKEYALKKGKTVFLNDVANTVCLDVTSFLGKAVDRLKGEDFTVVTLTAPKGQLPVPGTRGLPCDLATAYRLAEYGGTVLGVRSGFMDFLALADCRVIAINDVSYGETGFFDLASCWGDMNQKCSSLDYLDDEKTLSEVMEILRNDMAGG